MKIFLFVLIEGAGFLIDMCQSMKFLSDRECFGKNYRDTGYLKKNSMEWEIYKTDAMIAKYLIGTKTTGINGIQDS